jgi:WD40 repeat protein
MNFKKIVVVMGCCLVMLIIPVPQSTGGGPIVWSYQITRLSSSALSDDGERFLIGCNNGEYFIFDRYGNLVLNRTFEQKIHSVDIAENNSMIFGLENGVVLVDEQGNMLSREYFIGSVLHVSMARDGSYAVAGTHKEIFLMSPKGLRWKAEILVEDSQGSPSDKRGTSAVDQVEVSISKVAISEQGSTIAVAAQEKVFLFGSESERLKARIDMGFKVTSLVILPDESGVAIGTEGGTLSLYTIEGIRKFSIPQQGVPTSKALQGSINSIAASSEHIPVGTSEGKIYLFDREGIVLQEKDTFGNENFGSIKACDISDDGKVMVVLDSKGNVSFFNTLTGVGWEFTIRDPLFVELSKDGKYVEITGKNSIYFLDNWENTYDGTGFFPYPSRGSFSLENDLYRIWLYKATGTCVFDYGDINGDGLKEVVLGSGTELVVLNCQGKLMWKISFPSPVEVVWLHDVTEDAAPEIFIELDNGRLNMEVWSGEGNQLASFDFMGEFRVKPHPEEIGMEPIMAMDIDHDGIIEIISSVRIDYPGKSGGILVFDYPSGEIQWFYPISPFQTSYILTDINNDDNLELVLGSRSLCRGTAVGKRDDCRLYTMVVNLEGKEIWVKEIENVSGFMELLVAVSDLDGDGRKEIVGTIGSLDNTYGKLFILDSKGNYTYEREFSYSVWFGGIADFEKDGLKEIVVSDSEGRVVMYDHKPFLLKQFEVGEITTPYVKAIADLDGNGILEIVFVTDNGKLIVLDSSLAEIVSMKFDKKPEVIVANVSGCALDLLVNSSDKIELFSLRRERSNACPLIKESFLEYPEIYYEEAENHYIDLNFKGAGDYYNTAKTLYEKAGNIDMVIESTRMLERTENFCNALSRVESGRKKLTHIDFKKARYDFVDKEILFDVSLEDKSTRYGFIEEEILNNLISNDEDTIKAE